VDLADLVVNPRQARVLAGLEALLPQEGRHLAVAPLQLPPLSLAVQMSNRDRELQ
jgi:hypothetical protein